MITYPGNIQSALRDKARNGVWDFVGSGAPTVLTGANLAGPGSTYFDTATGIKYVNYGTKAVPVWQTPIQMLSGTITAAQIIGTAAGELGHANGVIMVPAGGAHVVNEFISAIIIMDFAVAAYAGGGNTGVKIGGGGIALSGVLANTVIIQAAADGVWYFNPLAATGIVLSENTALNFVTATAPTNPGTAAGVIRWKCTYRQHATGL